jgi:hypothetical protein
VSFKRRLDGGYDLPGKLRFDNLDVTNSEVVTKVLDALSDLAADANNVHSLEVSKRYYFITPSGPLVSDAGWYVICHSSQSIYVGTAENLNARLNSENGSRDQFANPQRTSDPERNFIKSFRTSGILGTLRVVVISEHQLSSKVGVSCPLTKRDRENVEKVLNLFREQVVSKSFEVHLPASPD